MMLEFVAPQPELFGSSGVQRSAVFSRDRENRLLLKRTWGLAERLVCFIGLNPSTADHKTDDPTVRRWMHFANAWGFDGFQAVNLFPFRSSSPAECRWWSDYRYARDDIQHNITFAAEIASESPLIVACWGAGLWGDAFMVRNLILEKIGHKPIYCFGRTLSGDPIHPMARGRHRVPDTARPMLWLSSGGAQL